MIGRRLVPAVGGTPTELTRPDRAWGEAQHLWPERLPDGHTVLFTIAAQSGGLGASQVAAIDLRKRTQTILLRGGSHAQYVASGHLAYVAGGTLRAVPFDVGRLNVRGAGALVVPSTGLQRSARDGSTMFLSPAEADRLGADDGLRLISTYQATR